MLYRSVYLLCMDFQIRMMDRKAYNKTGYRSTEFAHAFFAGVYFQMCVDVRSRFMKNVSISGGRQPLVHHRHQTQPNLMFPDTV
jgi:hypothetical protein